MSRFSNSLVALVAIAVGALMIWGDDKEQYVIKWGGDVEAETLNPSWVRESIDVSQANKDYVLQANNDYALQAETLHEIREKRILARQAEQRIRDLSPYNAILSHRVPVNIGEVKYNAQPGFLEELHTDLSQQGWTNLEFTPASPSESALGCLEDADAIKRSATWLRGNDIHEQRNGSSNSAQSWIVALRGRNVSETVLAFLTDPCRHIVSIAPLLPRVDFKIIGEERPYNATIRFDLLPAPNIYLDKDQNRALVMYDRRARYEASQPWSFKEPSTESCRESHEALSRLKDYFTDSMPIGRRYFDFDVCLETTGSISQVDQDIYILLLEIEEADQPLELSYSFAGQRQTFDRDHRAFRIEMPDVDIDRSERSLDEFILQ
ncbi:MAG: hypothetical protein AAF292_06490 [Pseudomonadota bacterium]